MGLKGNLPTGRVGRLARLAVSGAKTGSSLLFSKDSRKSALDSAAILGQLRGVATKVGQMASYVDGIVPPGHRDAFEAGMGKLQAAASESSPEAIRAAVAKELGSPVEELFDRWEDKPLASASIGQVHRAWLSDGTPVAVKVQHPGIAEAMAADLRNAGLVELAISATMGTAKFESRRMVQEVKERFLEELDYTLEATRQKKFAELHREDAAIHVPAVFDEFSSRGVLTSEFVEGRTFNEAREASAGERRLWAETLWRFVYRAILCEGLFNADPHPGNYVFREDGRISFLDFGCVQPMEEERRLNAATLHRAAHQGDMDTFRTSACRLLNTEGGEYEEMVSRYVQNCFKPIFEAPYCITQTYSASLVHEFKDMCLTLLKTTDDGFVPMPPGVLFINRLQFGFYSILARLNVEADYKATEMLYLEDAFKKG